MIHAEEGVCINKAKMERGGRVWVDRNREGYVWGRRGV
jgi:hypothetical protein